MFPIVGPTLGLTVRAATVEVRSIGDSQSARANSSSGGSASSRRDRLLEIVIWIALGASLRQRSRCNAENQQSARFVALCGRIQLLRIHINLLGNSFTDGRVTS